MTKRVQIVLGVLLIAAAGVIVLRVSKEQGPVYQGRTVDWWLDDMTLSNRIHRARDSGCFAALKQIGPKAIDPEAAAKAGVK